MRDRWQYYWGGSNPIKKTLALAGLGSLSPNCTHMVYPNYADRVAGNRHYYYSRALKAWSATGVTLARVEAKYDVIGGALTTVAANALGANGRIEPTSTCLCTTDLSNANWVEYSTTKEAQTVGPCESVGQLFNFWDNGAHYGMFDSELGGLSVAPYLFSVFSRGLVGGFRFCISGGGDFYSSDHIVNASWQRYASILTPANMTAHAGCRNKIAGGTQNIEFALINVTTDLYVQTPIITKGTRTADAYRIGSLSGLATAGGLVCMLRLPYASTVPAADQYHLGLNGSNSTDDGIFLFTDQTDGHLYADWRSGGASQGTIDLGAYAADTQYAIALGWSSAGLTGAINGVAKTSTSAGTVPASIDRLEIGRGISTDVAHGGETPLVMIFDSKPTAAQLLDLSGAALKASAFTGL